MRYMKLQRLDNQAILYQIHDDLGNHVRTTDVDGNTVPVGEKYSATCIDNFADPPAWATTETASVDEPPVYVPQTLTKRQFIINLYRNGMLTEQELGTAATTPPSGIMTLINALPADVAAEAKLTWSTMTQVDRDSGLISMAIALGLMTSAEMDQFFIDAAGI